MTNLIATLQSLPPLIAALIGVGLGFGLGLAHFASLRRVVRLYTSGGPVGRTLVLHMSRFVLLFAGLGLLAFLGAPALIAGALGIVLARGLVLRQSREAEDG
jgi:hypothetical protein